MPNQPGLACAATSDRGTSHTCSAGDPDEATKPAKKPRKQRPCFSCKECRRLKMRCDRKVPCSNCVRRRRVAFCTPVADASSRRPSDAQPAPAEPVGHPSGYAVQYPPLPNAIESHNPQAMLTPGPLTVSSGRTPRLSTASFTRSAPESLDNAEQSGPYGTLMMSRGGRSKYLGPTAGSEWLKNSQMHDVSRTPSVTRSPSPGFPAGFPSGIPPGFPPPPESFQVTQQPQFKAATIAFPFNVSAAHIRTRHLLDQLPPADEAWTLVDSYYRYCAWHYDVAPRARFKNTFDRVYALAAGGTLSPPVNCQELALVFIILATGTTYNIEMPINDSSAEEWLHLSEMALVKGDFLSTHTVAGVQTLHLMAHMNFQSDERRHDDKAWLLWGLVMRLIQAMGMHRDGARWNLPPNTVEERRKVFWECNAADTFQAHCFSRPCIINPDHCDTIFPESTNANGGKDYYRMRFELSQMSAMILNMAMKARRPPYSEVTELDQKLSEFEQSLPFHLCCRAAFIAMPSRYPRLEDAMDASPEPSRRSMTISFQQANLSLNICETVINLHRPYYAKALYDDVDVSEKSLYAPSFFAVIERCAMIIAIVTDIHTRFPAVSTRQWNFWFHVFGSALCLGTLVLRHPGHAMASFVLSQIDAAITLFNSLVHSASTPRYQQNLHWLSKLRARASAKISAASVEEALSAGDVGRALGRSSEEDGDDVELLGWRTRLVQQADQNRYITSSFPGLADSRTAKTSSLSPNDALVAAAQSLPQSTDELLHDFWDPIILYDLAQGNVQPNSFTNNSLSWWEDGTAMPDVN